MVQFEFTKSNKIDCTSVQYWSGNGPFKVQTFVMYLLCKLFENNFNQNHETLIGFNCIVVKEVYVDSSIAFT